MTAVEAALPTSEKTRARRASPTPRTFRPDIQGMRTVAVLLVVLYHAGVPGISGGFVGVDVFFVISGFLITGGLTREIARRGQISLWRFYSRRMRRLLPPAAIVLLVTVVLGRVLLPYSQALSLFKDAVFATFYGLNYRFAVNGVDYQNATAPPSALQHFWSLAVEEQFYVVWPIMLILCAFLGRRRLRTAVMVVAIMAICVISFRLSLTVTHSNAPMGYFSLQTRAWELGLGALVSLGADRLAKVPRYLAVGAAWLGLGLIVVTAFVYDDHTLYPGSAAAVPVVGAALMIAAGVQYNRRTPESVFLAHPVSQYIGRSSYAMYLWHWPLLIMLPLLAGRDLHLYERLEVVALAFWLAVLTYFVENASARSAWRSWRWLATGVGVSAGVAAVALSVTALMPALTGTGQARQLSGLRAADVGQVQQALTDALKTSQLPRNVSPTVTKAFDDVPSDGGSACLAQLTDVTTRACETGDTVNYTHTAVLVGDSHAHQWLSSLNVTALRERWRIIEVTKGACPIADVTVWNNTLNRMYTECDAFRSDAERRIAQIKPDLIIASQSDYVPWSSITDQQWATKTVTALTGLAAGRSKVVYIGDSPTTKANTLTCIQSNVGSVDKCDYSRADGYYAFPDRYPVMKADVDRAGFGFVDVKNFFCTYSYCPVVVGNIIVHRDEGHITNTYARWLSPMLAPVFEGTN